MARIRNIKPEFFSHEELQDMHIKHPELNLMLVFAGLFTQSERTGVFQWKTRILKLSILPFVDYDLEKSLSCLEEHNFIKKFVRDGKEYGYIWNFTKYQAISKYEKDQELKYPVPTAEELNTNSSMPETVVNNSETECEHMPTHMSEHMSTTLDLGLRTLDIGLMTHDTKESVCACEEPEQNLEEPEPPPQVFAPDPPMQQHHYPKLDWQELYREIIAAGFPDPGGEYRLNTLGRELLPYFDGLTREQIINAVKNYGSIRDKPWSWWKSNPNILTWAKKHLDKFLDGNFREFDYRDRGTAEKEQKQSEDDKYFAEMWERVRNEA